MVVVVFFWFDRWFCFFLMEKAGVVVVCFFWFDLEMFFLKKNRYCSCCLKGRQ